MGTERTPHDAAYKQFFSNPDMVESLLRDFVPAEFVNDLDFTTLSPYSESYVTDDLRERHDDIVWKICWKDGSACFVLLLLEFQSSPDHWMALRILSYTTLLLLDLVKSGQVTQTNGLPAVFPIVIYNGGKAWKAPQEVGALFAPMPESLRIYRPEHKHFLLDESSVSGDELHKKSTGLVAQLLRLERAQEPEQVRQVVKELIAQLHDSKYLTLRRAFTVWLGRVVLKRSGMTEEIPEFQDLQEVDAMLEERAAQWKDEYIQQGVIMGRAEGIAAGRLEGIAEGRLEGKAEGRLEGKAEGRLEGISLALQNLLESRFGSLPQSVVSHIAKVSDTNALLNLTLLASRAESLQAVIEHLKMIDKN